jgi:Fur family transcriptional regulator, ferric uptake regulator
MGMAHMKLTNQRTEIMEFLEGSNSHPSAEEVYQAVRKRLSRISKATVYQNLRFLARQGMLQEVNIKGVSRFEPNMAPHHHLICRKCGRIIDFHSAELTGYAMKMASKMKGMHIESASMQFQGFCDRCNRR